VRIGLDYDGVVRKYPYPFSSFLSALDPRDILVRCRLFLLRRLLIKSTVLLPTVINGPLLEKALREGECIIISGRYSKREEIEALGERYNLRVFLRESPSEREERFKERVIVREGVELYVEDRRFVREYLTEKGLKVTDPKEFLSENVRSDSSILGRSRE